jgi:hypothetical protein
MVLADFKIPGGVSGKHKMDSATTAPTKLSFSFKSKTTAKPPPPKPVQPAAFGFGDEEPDGDVVAPSSSKSGKPGKIGNANLRPPVQTQTAVTKAMQREMEAQKKVDATVYQYDEVYDRLKEAEKQAEKVKEEEAKIRQVYYPLFTTYLVSLLMILLAKIYRQFAAGR